MPRGIPKSKKLPTTERELSHKERDLAEWEESLSRRQHLYEEAGSNAEVKFKGLESKIAQRTEDLARLETEMVAKGAENEKTMTIILQSRDKAQERKEESERQLEQRQAEVKAVRESLARLQEQLSELESEVKDRKKYQLEQEELIDKSMREGNEELAARHREIKRTEQEREELLTKLHEDSLKSGALETQIGERQDDIVRLTQRYDDAAKEYRAKLVEVKLEIGEVETARDKVVAETNTKLLEIKSERAELEVTREVIRKQKEDIFSEKRRLESMKATYGM